MQLVIGRTDHRSHGSTDTMVALTNEIIVDAGIILIGISDQIMPLGRLLAPQAPLQGHITQFLSSGVMRLAAWYAMIDKIFDIPSHPTGREHIVHGDVAIG